ncbi:hypothetical protein EUREKA_64 [Mycobacterium phage Eureka]|uniref:Uncharacterized protein n=2 Tax=Kostyavirus eureka TaxID=1074306 RepID=G1JWT4_9CAUD|nr:hypothetical protein GOKU_64 [Mycobacterium phage Goku]YP_009591604.1 hypothetical protein FDG60_gp064 [Mycobacterium phage Eureka]AEL98079.1 hypothetical protein EUREKA_64 [Mycobacterium phage Eureka]AGT14172.1 hypothetical protein GOKU_64 [Mycobacterium phage Goku]
MVGVSPYFPRRFTHEELRHEGHREVNTIEILEKAKELAPTRWSRHRELGLRPNEPCCILGLVGVARFGNDWVPSYRSLEGDAEASAAVEALAAVSLKTGADAVAQVYTYNDRHLKTVAQVQSFIDRAIENHRG